MTSVDIYILGVFVDNFGIELKLFTGECVISKQKNIYCGRIYVSHISGKFTFCIF